MGTALSPLQQAAVRGCRTAGLSVLGSLSRADFTRAVWQTTADGTTALQLAMMHGAAGVATAIMDGIMAQGRSRGECAQKKLGLLNLVRHRDSLGRTAICCAVMFSNASCIEALLERLAHHCGPDSVRDVVWSASPRGTALHVAVLQRRHPCSETLVRCVAEHCGAAAAVDLVRQADDDGCTPLCHALRCADPVAVDAMLACVGKHAGAQAVAGLLKQAAVTANGWTRLHWAAFDNHGAQAKLIIDSTTKHCGKGHVLSVVCQGDAKDMSALHVAALYGCSEAACAIIDAVAACVQSEVLEVTQQVTRDDWSPVDLAAATGHPDTIAAILAKAAHHCGGGAALDTILSEQTRKVGGLSSIALAVMNPNRGDALSAMMDAVLAHGTAKMLTDAIQSPLQLMARSGMVSDAQRIVGLVKTRCPDAAMDISC
jgi:ankyrin repeat protein